jgi:hypothetical protein
MTLDELKALIEAEALARTAARDGFTLEAVESFLGQGVVAPPELATHAPEPPERLTMGYFSQLHGEHLIRTAYTLLLGRGADAGGMNHFMTQLANGADKALVVGSLRYSPEGRARGVPVAGLFVRFAVAAASRLPVLGTILEWLVAAATLHSRARHARALEHHFQARLDAMGRYVGQSGAQVATRVEALRSVLASRD